MLDWPSRYEPLALECNESANFLVPSSRTNSTGMSPSIHSEAQQTKNGYLISPSVIGSRAPYPVVPSVSAHAMTLPYAASGAFVDMKSAKQQKFLEICCSWKALTYVLASALIFSLAVICYLLVVLSSVPSSPSPSTSVHTVEAGKGRDPAVVEYESARPFPDSVALGDVVVVDLAPSVMNTGEFLLSHDCHVQFNTSVSPQTRLAFFLRQTLPPSITQHDFHEIILGSRLHAQPYKRSVL